jgi:hypothetical protein
VGQHVAQMTPQTRADLVNAGSAVSPPRAAQLEQENARLKEVMADLRLDNAMLKEVADPEFLRRQAVIKARQRLGVSTRGTLGASSA